MQTIYELLNKIKWCEKGDFKILYKDRFKEDLQEINFNKIKEINKLTIIFDLEDREIELPLHRIKKVYKDNICIWRRI